MTKVKPFLSFSNTFVFIRSILSVLIFALLLSLQASSFNVICNGDNLRCGTVKIRGNQINMTMNNWNMHFIINNSEPFEQFELNFLNLDKLSYKPNYWTTQSNPSIKVGCDRDFSFQYPSLSTVKKKGYSVISNCPEVRISTFIPYTYTWMIEDVKKVSEDVKFLNLSSGLQMPVIKYGNPMNHSMCIAMVSRQHSTEMYMSYYIKGILQALSIQNETNASWLVIPMANPDGVFRATYHLNGANQDLNDCWDTMDCQEVQMIAQELESFKEECGKIDLGIDWHSGNLGTYSRDTILFTTEQERNLSAFIRTRTNFSALSKYNDTGEKLAYYFRNHFNASAITMEVQMVNDTIHTIENMEEQGLRTYWAIRDYYNISDNIYQEEINVTQNETFNVSEEEPRFTLSQISGALNQSNISEEKKEEILNYLFSER